ncbi:MAG TPA: type II secretion system protein [Acidimicrobiales bacterium]|nr:type II secretion system protein [Acidimicrobiales bacterium]
MLTGPLAVPGHLTKATALDEGGEDGFTLIELMVVLLIMAILMAVAVPTFLGTRSGAEDRSAQSDLVNSAIAGKSLFATNGSFAPLANSQVSELQAEEPELNYTTADVTAGSPPHTIDVAVSPDEKVLLMVDQSQTGRCWIIEVNEESSPNAAVPSHWTQTLGVSFAGSPTGAGPPFCRTSAPTLAPGQLVGGTYYQTWPS